MHCKCLTPRIEPLLCHAHLLPSPMWQYPLTFATLLLAMRIQMHTTLLKVLLQCSANNDSLRIVSLFLWHRSLSAKLQAQQHPFVALGMLPVSEMCYELWLTCRANMADQTADAVQSWRPLL